MKLEMAEKLMLFLIIAMILVGAVIMAAESVAVFGFVLCMGLLLAILVIHLLYIRCPHCGEHLGRDRGEFCPHCGKKLRKNTPEN